MNPCRLLIAVAFCLALAGTRSAFAQDASPPYDGSWASLQKMPVPAWFDDGKIGIFIHWGPYSVIGYRKNNRGYAEHVPKMMYRDSDHYFPVIKERWGKQPPEFGYKDIIPDFKAENWDPDAWAKLFADVGFKYCVMTAEHHDGWANWDSDLTPWNAMDMGPKRDLVGDLGKALKKQGLKFAPSYHRERHQSFFAKKLYTVKAEPLPMIAEEIKRSPKAASLYGPFGTTEAFVDDYVARWKEMQTKYQPDMLWMDDFPIYTRDGNKVRNGKAKPEIQYFDDQVRGMITDFMNDGAARGADVYVNNKGGNRNWPAGVGCLEKDNLKLKVIGPKWESCTTFGTSFGYLKGDKYKSVESVIHELVEVISRNGNFLINIGPKPDGTIAEPQMERLLAMKRWLDVNGKAIYGSRYWRQFEQKDERLAFTTNGEKLYAIKLRKPVAPFVISGTAGWGQQKIKSVRLLGSDAKVNSMMTPQGLQITPPNDLGQTEHAWAFEILTDENQHSPNAIVLDEDKALKGTKKVDLNGRATDADEQRSKVKPGAGQGAEQKKGNTKENANLFPGDKVDFHGFDRYTFKTDGVRVSVVCPDKAMPGKPWLWRSMFWGKTKGAAGRVTLMDLELIKQGYHVVIRPGDVSGHPRGNVAIDAAYEYLTQQHGFSTKVAMGSMSRETLALFQWASANPEKVASIYVDNGVCNVNSWPGGKLVTGTESKGDGAPKSWKLLKKTYGFESDAEAVAAKVSPIDWLEPLAKAGVPILLCSGTKDTTVPYEENAAILKERYESLGGSAKVILEEKKHHPHGLKDTTPVIDFIKKHTPRS